MKKIFLILISILYLPNCSFSFENGIEDERIQRSELISLLAVANSNRSIILGNTRIYKSTITNTTNNTPVAISFDTIIYDSNNSFNLNDPTKITITKSGLYQTTGQLSYATNGTGIRKVNLVLNDISVIGSTAVPAATGDLTNISTESIYRLIAGDFIRLQGFQSSGGALDIAVNSGYSQVLTLTRISD